MTKVLLIIAILITVGCGKDIDSDLRFPFHPVTSTCGGENDSCYTNANALALGFAQTPSGKNIAYVDADAGLSGTLHIWVEDLPSGNVRVLDPAGYDTWQMKLTANGRSDSPVEFTLAKGSTYSVTGTNYHITGRVCPTNVYYSPTGNNVASDFTNTGKCLFYVDTQTAHTLDEDTSTQGTTGLSLWSNANSGSGAQASWYETNHYVCRDLGLRLPTLYETTNSSCSTMGGTFPNCNYYPNDVSPSFALTGGVPMSAGGLHQTWTASADKNTSMAGWAFNSSSAAVENMYSSSNYIVCVAP